MNSTSTMSHEKFLVGSLSQFRVNNPSHQTSVYKRLHETTGQSCLWPHTVTTGTATTWCCYVNAEHQRRHHFSYCPHSAEPPPAFMATFPLAVATQWCGRVPMGTNGRTNRQTDGRIDRQTDAIHKIPSRITITIGFSGSSSPTLSFSIFSPVHYTTAFTHPTIFKSLFCFKAVSFSAS